MTTQTPKPVKTVGGISILAILTDATCAMGCWTAQEDVCRCSCGGRNHGAMRTADGVQPQRTAKIDGIFYTLEAVGEGSEMQTEGDKVNATVKGAIMTGYPPKSDGSLPRYRWWTTERGAPARVKSATQSQLEKWPELKAMRERDKTDQRIRPAYLLWVRADIAEFRERMEKTK